MTTTVRDAERAIRELLEADRDLVRELLATDEVLRRKLREIAYAEPSADERAAMAETTGRFCWATNDEGPFRGDCATREEAIAEARDWYSGDDAEDLPRTIYIGVVADPMTRVHVSAESIVEMLDNAAYDEAGDVTDGWPAASKADMAVLQERLDAMIAEWVRDCALTPTWFCVDHTEEVPFDPEASR